MQRLSLLTIADFFFTATKLGYNQLASSIGLTGRRHRGRRRFHMKLGMMFGALAALACAVFAGKANAAAPTLTMGNTGLVYTADSLGNTISDFSYVGYKGGTASIPTLPVKKIISPVAGDNTSNIQNAINAVAAMSADSNGFRGALYLNAGTYPCSGTISWGTSGVVLRGAGNGTIIQATGTSRTLIS